MDIKEGRMKGYKGFDKDFKCQGFQYEVGKEYEHPGKVKCCPNDSDIRAGKGGFHFCLNPLDVFGYYPPTERFAEITSDGEHQEHTEDSKVACKRIKIDAEISLDAMIKAGVKFIFDKVDWTNKPATNTGYQSAATNTGNRSAATNTGDQSAATNTGDLSAASVEGKDSIACGLGYDCKAKGALGCWIVLAERNDNYEIITVKSAKVDGKKIKADTWYKLEGGKFMVF